MTDKGAGLRSLAFYGVARCRRVGFLFGKTISIELGDHNAVADVNETPADLVLRNRARMPIVRTITEACQYIW